MLRLSQITSQSICLHDPQSKLQPFFLNIKKDHNYWSNQHHQSAGLITSPRPLITFTKVWVVLSPVLLLILTSNLSQLCFFKWFLVISEWNIVAMGWCIPESKYLYFFYYLAFFPWHNFVCGFNVFLQLKSLWAYKQRCVCPPWTICKANPLSHGCMQTMTNNETNVPAGSSVVKKSISYNTSKNLNTNMVNLSFNLQKHIFWPPGGSRNTLWAQHWHLIALQLVQVHPAFLLINVTHCH